MLERTGAITNEGLEPITFVVAYPATIYCFSTATMVKRTPLNVTSHVAYTACLVNIK